jgi:hypothetical protein
MSTHYPTLTLRGSKATFRFIVIFMIFQYLNILKSYYLLVPRVTMLRHWEREKNQCATLWAMGQEVQHFVPVSPENARYSAKVNGDKGVSTPNWQGWNRNRKKIWLCFLMTWAIKLLTNYADGKKQYSKSNAPNQMSTIKSAGASSQCQPVTEEHNELLHIYDHFCLLTSAL